MTVVPLQEGPTRAAILAAARRWIGTPYRHQASVPGIGADCLGLLRGVWREVIGEEPEALSPYGPGWAEAAGGERLIGAAERHLVRRADAIPWPGAVLFFRWKRHLPVKHCGIASGEGFFIHAHDGASVAEVALVPGWRRRIAAIYDFPGIQDQGVQD